jgi:hypothetical protein
MNLDQIRKQQKQKQPEKTSSTGSRIQVVSVENEEILELVRSHYEGKTSKKEGEAKLSRARRLYAIVANKLLKDRSKERPKQFKFNAKLEVERTAEEHDVDFGHATNIGDKIKEVVDHTTTINVREQGYGSFDDGTLDDIKGLLGDSFPDTYITTHVEAKVDFSLVPTDKQEAVIALLSQVNEFVGTEVINWEIKNKPNSMFHQARTELTEEQDRKLNEILPISLAFGR